MLMLTVIALVYFCHLFLYQVISAPVRLGSVVVIVAHISPNFSFYVFIFRLCVVMKKVSL